MRQSLHDWLSDMKLVPADEGAILDRYIGYYEPYATSHDALDRDEPLFEETRNAAHILMKAIDDVRAGRRRTDFDVKEARPK